MLPLVLTALALSFGDGLPVKAPAAVGMSAERLRAIDRVVQRGLNAGGYPGAAVVVGRKGAVVWKKGFGRLDWTTNGKRVSADESLYDLASLTKVVATTAAIMVLYDEGRIALDAPVRRYLPAFSGGLKDQVTLRQLLTHTSGLPADRALWRLARTPAEARQLVLSATLQSRPGTRYVYSDLGADLLGFVVEAVSGVPLDRFVQQRIYGPLGMTHTTFRPADSLRAVTAPTEVAPPRGYPLRGEVHDENAYALGGVAGHAGLFSTASDLAVFAQMMLNGGAYNGVRIVSDSTVRLFTQQTTGNRALGWAMADGTWGSGEYLSSSAYGHVGYTGTSLWIDPEREMFVILLTNRVHAPRAKRPAKVIADVRADLSDAAALAVTEGDTPVLAMPPAFRADLAKGWNPPRHVHRARAAAKQRHRAPVKATSKATGHAAAAKKTAAAKTSAARKTAASKRAAAAKRTRSTAGVTTKKHPASSSAAKRSPAK